MEIREITDKNIWEDFLESCTQKSFLQSFNWGEFNEKMGNKIWRFGAFSENEIIALALVIKISAKRGTFLFIPHGPVVNNNLTARDKKEILELLISRLSEIAKNENASFIRISPLFFRNEENENIFLDLGFRNSPMHSSAYEATWKLDLLEEDILHNMRKTTRYLIKKVSENKDVVIEKSENLDDIKIYQELNKKVAKRQKFTPFSGNFIKNEFEIFAKDKEALFLFGKYKGEIVCGALIIFWSGMAFYHQAASLGKFAKYSVPYLLQWEAIKEAEKRECKIYDFWGFTDPEKFPKHPWAGPTLFKMGFGGYKEEYILTQDYVLSNKYWINYFIEKARKLYRRL